MSLQKRMRAFCAPIIPACPAIAAPASAAPPNTGLGTTVGLPASTQLTALTTAIQVSGAFFAGHRTDCSTVTPILASQPGPIMAGNFRDANGACYVWLNLAHSALLSGSEICKVGLHEMGHLHGLMHSDDHVDVMYSPFDASVTPPPGAAPARVAKPAGRTKSKRRLTAVAHARRRCLPGGTGSRPQALVAASVDR
jgi:hypothetical protein